MTAVIMFDDGIEASIIEVQKRSVTIFHAWLKSTHNAPHGTIERMSFFFNSIENPTQGIWNNIMMDEMWKAWQQMYGKTWA